MGVIEFVKKKIKSYDAKIIFPEYEDRRILSAVITLNSMGVLTPILIGNPITIRAAFKKNKLDGSEIKIVNSKDDALIERYAQNLVELRKEKELSLVDAKKLLEDEIYVATMMLKLGEVDGVVSGAMHPTKHTLKPAFQIIKTVSDRKIASGFFIMVKDAKTMFLFADCAVNPDPSPAELADIALATADSAKLLGLNPKVALLSFSTLGSADHPLVEKVRLATKIAKELSQYPIEGEIQFDAATNPEVSKLKIKHSLLKGKANVFIFPDLNSGNIGYKLAQYFGKLEAIGPIVQGLDKPVNDLSRGCSVQEIIDVAIITALQAKQANNRG